MAVDAHNDYDTGSIYCKYRAEEDYKLLDSNGRAYTCFHHSTDEEGLDNEKRDSAALITDTVSHASFYEPFRASFYEPFRFRSLDLECLDIDICFVFGTHGTFDVSHSPLQFYKGSALSSHSIL